MSKKYYAGNFSGAETDKTIDLRKPKSPLQNKWVYPEPDKDISVSSSDHPDDEDVEDEYKKFFLREKLKREENKQELNEKEIAGLGAEALICLKKGSLTKALEIYQNSLLSLGRIKGVESQEYRRYYEIIIGVLNKYAIKHLEKKNIEKSLNILFECEDLTKLSKAKASYSPSLRAQTFMNLGMVYKTISRPKKALRFLDEALKIILNHKLEELAGSAYLNICTLFSKLGSHTKALQYAKNALIFSQNDLLNYLQNKSASKNQKKYEEKINIVASAFHNMGVEQEFHQHYEKALDWYRKSYEFVESKLGGDADLAKKFKNIYEEAKTKLVKKILFHKEKPFDNPMNLAKKTMEYRTRPKSATQKKKYETDTDTPMQEKKKKIAAQQSNNTATNMNFYFEGNTLRKRPPTEYSIKRLSPSTYMAATFKRAPNDENHNLRETKKVEANKGNHFVKERKENVRLEMMELERMGILEWDEENGDIQTLESEEEGMIDFKQQRAHFLQRLNKLGEGIKGNIGDPLDYYFEEVNEDATYQNLRASDREKLLRAEKREKTLIKNQESKKVMNKNKPAINEIALFSEQSVESFDESQIMNIDELMRNLNGVKNALKKTRNQELQTDEFMFLDPEPVLDPKDQRRQSIGVATSVLDLKVLENQVKDKDPFLIVEQEDQNINKDQDSSITESFIFDRNKRIEELRDLGKRMKKMNEAASIIQRFIRGRIQFQRFSAYKSKRIQDKHLVYQRVMNLHPNDGSPEFLTNFYILRIYYSVSRKSLHWFLKCLDNKKSCHETYIDVNVKVDLDRHNKLNSETLRSLREFILERKQFMYIHKNNSIEFRDKDPKLPLLGTDSLDVSHIDYFSEEGERDKKSHKFIEENHYLKGIIKIQNFFKGYIVKRQTKHQKARQLKLLFKSIWLVEKGVYTEIRCFLKFKPGSKKNNLVLVTGVLYSDKTRRIAQLIFPQSLCQHYGNALNKSNIAELVRVDIKKPAFLLTEEAEYWLEMDRRKLEQVGVQAQKIDEKYVITIQKVFRGFLQRRKFEIILKKKRNMKIASLTEFGRRYIIDMNYPYLIGIYYDTKYKNILIKIIKKPPELIAVENKQKLYEQFEINDLKRYCLIILKQAKLLKVSDNQIKVISRRIEQIKAERGDESTKGKQITRDDIKVVKKDPLFETKLEEAWIRINMAIQNNISPNIQYYDEPMNEEEEAENRVVIDIPVRVNPDHKHNRSARKIQKAFRAYRFRLRISQICELRSIERSKIASYRLYHKIDQLQMTRARSLADQIQQKMMESNNMIFVGRENHKFKDGVECLVAVYFHEEFQSLIIETKLKSSEKIKQICIPLPVLGFSEFNHYIKDDLKNLILPRLRLSGDDVFFQYDPRKIENMEKLTTFRPPDDPKPLKLERKSTIQVSHSRTPSQKQNFAVNLSEIPDASKTYGSKLDMSNIARKKIKSLKGGVSLKQEDIVELTVTSLIKKFDDKCYLLTFSVRIALSNALFVNFKSLDDSQEDLTMEIIDFERDLDFISESINAVIRKQIKQFITKQEKNKQANKTVKEEPILPFLGNDIGVLDFHKMDSSWVVDEQSYGSFIQLLEEAVNRETKISKIQNFFKGKIQKFKLQSLRNERASLHICRKCLHIGTYYIELRFFINREENVILLNTLNLNYTGEERRKSSKFWKLKFEDFLPRLAKQMKEMKPYQKTSSFLVKEVAKSVPTLLNEELSIKVVNDIIRVNSKKGHLVKEIELIKDEDTKLHRLETKKENMNASLRLDMKKKANTIVKSRTKTAEEERLDKILCIQKHFRKMVVFKNYKSLKAISDKITRIFFRVEIKSSSQNYFIVIYHYLIGKAQFVFYIINISKSKRILKGYYLELRVLSEDIFKHLQKQESLRKITLPEYKKMLEPIFNYARKNISLDLVSNELWVSFLDPKVSLNQIPMREIQKLNIDSVTSNKRVKLVMDTAISIITIQRFFRRKRAEYIALIKKEGGRLKESTTKRYGHLLKKNIKNISGTFYWIWIYRKDDQMLTIIAQEMDVKEKRLKFSYNMEQNGLLNTGGLPIEDFLIQNLIISNGQLKLSDLNREVVVEGSPEKEMMNKIKLAFSENDSGNRASLAIPTFQKIDDELVLNKDDGDDDVVIIHQKTDKINDETKCLFNVYYNEQGNNTSGKKLDNIIQIEVDLKDLRKQNPMLTLSTPDSLRNLAEDLTKAIKVGSNGDIVVDSSKVDPRCLNIKEKKLRISQDSSSEIKESMNKSKRRENSKTKCISKAIKFFGNTKYLLIVNYIERPLEQNIRNISHDEVYEEYEILFEISAANLSKKNLSPITWEVSMTEAFSLSYSRDIFETAKFFIDHLNVFNDQFVISVTKRNDIYKVSDKNVIVLYEKVIVMLQRLFRNRKYKFNHLKFKEEIELHKNNIISKQIVRDGRSFYLFICVDKPLSNNLEVFAWDLIIFEKVGYSINKELFESDFKENKYLLGDKIIKTMSISFDFSSGNSVKKIVFDAKMCQELLLRAKKNPKKFLERKTTSDFRPDNYKPLINVETKVPKSALSKKGSYFPSSPTKK